jgi:hypothetical protein
VKRSIGTGVLVALVLGAVSLVGSALADSGGDNDRVLRSEVVGNTARGEGGPTLFGVDAAGATWVVAASDVDARRDGRLEVKVEGLVLKNTGTVGNNTAVMASLYCGGKAVGTTAPAPLSPEGDAEIRDTIAAAPEKCEAPTVFVHPAGRPLTYFAVTGA